MNDLLVSSLPWLPASILPLVALMLTPLLAERGRSVVAVLLALAALTAVGVAIAAGTAERSLEVVNAFPKGSDGDLRPLVFETVRAPAWQWGAVAAALLAAAAIATFLTRRIKVRPGLVLHLFVLGAWLLAARLLLEKSAAPAELVWATGMSMAIVPFVLMQGIYAGRAGDGFKSLLVGVVVLAVLQRALISGVSYWLTVEHLGTHLDFTPLDGFESRFMSEPVVFGDDVVEKWKSAGLIPQMLMWAPFQVIVGLVVGGIAWRCSRRAPAGL